MSQFLVLVSTFTVSVIMAVTLVLLLPGHYHSDETKLQTTSENFDWSRSWDNPDQPLVSLILDTFAYSISLQLVSFFIALVFSFLLSLAALKWSKLSVFIEKFLIFGISAPALFWIPLLVYFFSLKLNLFPLRFEPTFAGWILPLIGLSLRPVCLSTQILLTEWKKSEEKSYFLVARSKGLSRIQVFYKHGLKNALIPYTTQMANFLVQSLMGSVLVESLFGFPGMGLFFVESLQNRDLPVILVLTLLFTFLMMLIHGLAEYFQTILEPRGRRVEV